MRILNRARRALQLAAFALLAAGASVHADAGYDSLASAVTAGVVQMKAGVSPILSAIVGLTLFISGLALVVSFIRSRKPKVV